MVTMRRVLALLVVLAFVACGGAAVPSPAPNAPASAAKPVRLVIGFSEIYEGALPMWYAASKGVFTKHGIDIDLRYTQSSTGIAALLSGETQIFQGGGSEALSAVAGGEDLVVVGNLVPVYPYVFMVPANIKTAADLKGKTVGVSMPGSTSDIATRVALPAIGIDPDKDVNIIAVGSSQNRTAAMLNGSIQGGLDQPPGSFALEAKGFHVLFDMVSLKLPVVNNGIIAKRAWVNANKDTAQRYVDSLVEAIAMVRSDKAGAQDVLKKELKIDEQKVLDGTYDAAVKLFPAYPHARPEHFGDSLKVLTPKNPKLQGFDVTKIIDDTLVKSAEDRKLGG